MKNPGLSSESMDARRMRAHNSVHVLKIVKKSGAVSRADITRKTRLSTPTVSALVTNLLRAGLLEEHGEGTSNGGRKPQLVSFNARCGVVLGGNIGTTAAHLTLNDMNGERISRERVQLADTRPHPLLKCLTGAIRQMVKSAGCGHIPLLAVVVGAPGMTDMNRGVVLEAANLEGWENVPARDILHKTLRVPVVVDNDVNLAAIGEHWRGGGRGIHNFVFISMGTGIGAGIVIDDKIHRGHKWHAGEISHLNVDFKEWNTDFGAAGYLESYLGAPPRTGAKRALRRHSGQLDETAILRLGAAVANIATIIDPELIILGGRVALTHPESIASVHKVAARIAPNCPEIRATQLGEDAALLGSVRVALDLANESLHELLLDSSPAAA
ncbi:MAG: ROK family transcriptional regulator [Pyrinomonadaceae bacterium]